MTSSGEYVSEEPSEDCAGCSCPGCPLGGVVTVGEAVGVVVVGAGVPVVVGAVVVVTRVGVPDVCVV